MQVQKLDAQIVNQSRQISQKDSVISKKSIQKQQLRKEIQFLKDEVKKLKNDNFKHKISCPPDNDKTIQFQNDPIPSIIERLSNKNYESNQDLSILQSLHKENYINIQLDKQNNRLIKQQNDKQSIEQPMMNFRVGRIVKNNLTNSSIKNKTQSKTIQVRKTSNYRTIILNKSSNMPFVNNRNSNAESESQLLFKTIQNRQKPTQQKDCQAYATQNNKKNILSNFFANQIKFDKQQKNLFSNFNDTFQSSELCISNNRTMSHDLSSQQVLIANKLSKSTNLNVPQILPIHSHTKTDITGISNNYINPEYRSYQMEDQGRQKTVNIRKISFKLKKENKEKYSQTENTIQLQTHFTNLDQENIDKNHSSRYTKHQKSTSDNQRSRFFSSTSIPPTSRTFKSRLLNIDKLSKISIGDEFKPKLQGKITKNFTYSLNQSQKYSLNSQNHSFIINNIPNNCFSLKQMPYLPDRPHQKSNQEEIIQMTLKIAKKLGINEIKRQLLQGIIIKKFKNCLIFKIPNINKKIIWYYEGRLYFGEGDKQGQQGYKSGQGMQYVPDKSFYKGQYLQNKKHGSGTIITAKGDIYEGQWFEGYYHGNGKFEDSQLKSIYEGEFKKGKSDGFGILKKSETQIYKGTFVKNVKHGFGVQLFKNGDKYKGQYEQRKFHGRGQYKWSNGSIYIGQFFMGIRTGLGEWRSSSEGGDSYVGMYSSDKKHGLGRYCWQDGSVYEGHFDKDQKHGYGLLIYKDNKTVHGRWENNKLVEVIEAQHDEQNDQNSLQEECLKIKLASNVTNEVAQLQFLVNN